LGRAVRTKPIEIVGIKIGDKEALIKDPDDEKMVFQAIIDIDELIMNIGVLAMKRENKFLGLMKGDFEKDWMVMIEIPSTFRVTEWGIGNFMGKKGRTLAIKGKGYVKYFKYNPSSDEFISKGNIRTDLIMLAGNTSFRKLGRDYEIIERGLETFKISLKNLGI